LNSQTASLCGRHHFNGASCGIAVIEVIEVIEVIGVSRRI
jgi:hypothetical protein